MVGDFGLGEGEQRCGVDVGRAGCFCDDGGAGILDALARQTFRLDPTRSIAVLERQERNSSVAMLPR